VATKGGLARKGKEWFPDGRARHLREACEASLRNLEVDAIDLYQLHAKDPKVPLGTSLRALAALANERKIRRVGLSNLGLEDLEEACRIVEVASVQVALSPLDLTPLKNGVAELCAQKGFSLLAHSPLGGYRNRGKLERLDPLRRIARRRNASVEEITLAWLRSLHPSLVPLPGTSRVSSLESILASEGVVLQPEDLEELEEAFPAAKLLRVQRAAIAPSPTAARGEVVLFVGYPGAGKSTLAADYAHGGYEVLSRDVAGGTLEDARRKLDERLASGARRIVLDNTYPERASRYDVLETAWRHEASVRCVWLQTSLEEAQVNAVSRMVRKYGRLLSPEEMAKHSRTDPNSFPPDAQFRFRGRFEPPRAEEGFLELRAVPFVRRGAWGSRRALFFDVDGVVRRTKSGATRPKQPDDVEILPNRREALSRYASEGYLLLGVSHQPGIAEEAARACFARTSEILGLPIEHEFCPHDAGPAACWCRKPLPGLGVLLLERHGIDPARSLLIAASPADKGFAARLGIPTIDPEECFGRRERERRA
jgi:diketogulonate reductase-like aldo/keto reductase/histidinol phosphatase-like enzyme/predicted kinase